MAELALYVDSLPKKGNLAQQSQHRTSCLWYNWREQDKNHYHSNSRLDVQTANQGSYAHTQPPTFIRRIDRMGDRRRASTAEPKQIVPRGEATDKNIFKFSQHDNRHRITAPEKKTILSQDDRQRQSRNITNTMVWSNNIKDGEFQITKTSPDREIYKVDLNAASIRTPNFRRFPKRHHASCARQEALKTRRSQSNLLAQDGTEGGEPARISLPILAQPQSYIGFQASQPKNNSTNKAEDKMATRQRAKTSPGGWCYSYHGKTFSKRVSNATQHACYRF